MKDTLKRGDILNFYGRKDLVSRIISLFTNSNYTHTACYLGDGHIIESDWGGVGIRELPSNNEYDAFRHKYADKKDLDMAVIWMESQIGAKYDYLGIFGIALNTFGIKGRDTFDDSTRYWCSELIADGYLNMDIDLDIEKHTWLVSPGDLAKDKNLYKILK